MMTGVLGLSLFKFRGDLKTIHIDHPVRQNHGVEGLIAENFDTRSPCQSCEDAIPPFPRRAGEAEARVPERALAGVELFSTAKAHSVDVFAEEGLNILDRMFILRESRLQKIRA